MIRITMYAFIAVLMINVSGCSFIDGPDTTDQDSDNKASEQSPSAEQDTEKEDEGEDKEDEGSKEEEIVINVEAIQLIKGDAVSVFNTTTIIEADLESAVTSKASGIVLSINVEVGDAVKEGDVLAVLESDAQKLRLQSANANYQKSSHNYERAKTLLEKGLVNQESVDNLKFETQSLKTSLDQAKMDVDFTKITAPISGVITKRSIKKGNLIQPNTAVYEIVNFDSLQAVINVPESKWGAFETGLSVVFNFSSMGKNFYGSILRIDPIVDSTTGTFKVVIALDESDATLRPGLFGKAQIILDKRENALLIDKDAVIREDRNTFAFVVNEDSTVTKTPITLGYQLQDHIEVLEGLTDNQSVVTTGKNNLSSGSKIKVIEYDD